MFLCPVTTRSGSKWLVSKHSSSRHWLVLQEVLQDYDRSRGKWLWFILHIHLLNTGCWQLKSSLFLSWTRSCMGLLVLNMFQATVRIFLVIYCLTSYKILHVIISLSFLLFYFIFFIFLPFTFRIRGIDFDFISLFMINLKMCLDSLSPVLRDHIVVSQHLKSLTLKGSFGFNAWDRKIRICICERLICKLLY